MGDYSANNISFDSGAFMLNMWCVVIISLNRELVGEVSNYDQTQLAAGWMQKTFCY